MVFVIIAAVFAIAGLFPQLSAVLSAIPQPVIGGATVGVFGTITMNGVRMFTREGLTQRTTTIVGTSVVFGLGIWMASGCLAGEGMPAWVSTVIGSKGSPDTDRDPRGFAVKFYTSQGNYDVVGLSLPVFFIRDAMQFPDFIHSQKPIPARISKTMRMSGTFSPSHRKAFIS